MYQSYRAAIEIQGSPLDSQSKYTGFQGHDVIKVKVRHNLKVTLTAKFVEHSRVALVSKLLTPRFQI